MSKTLIVANWKMNPKSFKDAAKLFEMVEKNVKLSKDAEVVVCPPFLWLRELRSKKLSLGAQNCHFQMSGAFTGEVSSLMLTDAKVEYVILGHSERRQMGETDAQINLKVKTALKDGLKPILCIGEKEDEEINLVLERQITQALEKITASQLEQVAIAYEPVWAIGTGKACSADNALSATLFIRRILTKLYSRFLAEKTPILYGGSVSSENCAQYLDRSGMNGLLVGGASLDADQFVKIINTVSKR